MKAAIYVIRDACAIEFGQSGRAVLDPPYNLVDSSIWVTEHEVELPDGFSVEMSNGLTKELYKDGEHYSPAVDKDEKPVIVDHKNGGRYIRLMEVDM